VEESVTFSDFLEYYKKSMGLEPVDVRTYSPLVLAYIGDAVYELMIRSKVINHGSMQVNKMHKHSAALVKASAQAQLIKALQEELTEEDFSNALDTAGLPDPDLLIRTCNEQRISNFLLWQLAYTEFYFTPVAWPDFTKEELLKAVEAYNHRDRRFGLVKDV